MSGSSIRTPQKSRASSRANQATCSSQLHTCPPPPRGTQQVPETGAPPALFYAQIFPGKASRAVLTGDPVHIFRASLPSPSKSQSSVYFSPGKKNFFFFLQKHLLNKQHVNRNSCFRLHKCLIVSSRACPWQAVGRAGRGHFPPPLGSPGGRPRNTAPGPSVSLTLRTDRQTNTWTLGSDPVGQGSSGSCSLHTGPGHLSHAMGRRLVVAGPRVATLAAGRSPL